MPERRQVTVLICDIVGSTDLSSRLDPEDLRDIYGIYDKTCGQVISAHEGFVCQYRGDGLIACFGYPQVDEDSAERAVQAGMAIVRSIQNLKIPLATLRVRVGIATGMAIVGDAMGKGPAEHIAIIGQVANVSARVQEVAQPDWVVIADSTQALVGRRFDYEELGLHRLKGIDRDIGIWRVIGHREDVARFDASSRQQGRFIGRASELDHLAQSWLASSSGRGQVVQVLGEAGIGKSSLLRQASRQMGLGVAVRITLQCSSRHKDSPLYPILVHLQRAAGLEPDDSPEDKLAKIEKMLAPAGQSSYAPLFASLMGIPNGKHDPPSTLLPQKQRADTLKLLGDQIAALSDVHPVLMLVEDAHWMDPTTDELASYLVDIIKNKRVMIVATSRTELTSPWTNAPNVSSLRLFGLDNEDSEQLVRLTSGDVLLPSALTAEIVARTDGVPLFVEELTKSILESGTLRHATLAAEGTRLRTALSIPSTLHDSLMARLDRLGSTKRIAQIGAVVGRKFSAKMLAQTDQIKTMELDEALARLVTAELVVKRGEPPDVEYSFRHALVQDAAYSSLLRDERRRLHRCIAEAIEREYPTVTAEEPEILAHHWMQADWPAEAATYWLRAGERALARAANVEAIRHLAQGILMLDRIDPETRAALDCMLHLRFGQASYVWNGPAHVETVTAYSRAQELIEFISNPEQRYQLLYGIFSGYHFASKFDLAAEPARRAMILAQHDNDAGQMCQAHRMLGYICFFLGDTAGAQSHFRDLEQLYDPDQHGRFASHFGADCLVAARGFDIVIEGISGRLENAIAMADANRRHAIKLGHPASIGWALASECYLYFFLQDRQKVHEASKEGIKFCQENNVSVWGGHCRLFALWADPDRGMHVEEIKREINEAVSRIGLGAPLFRAALADALIAACCADQALDEANLALSEMTSLQQFIFEPVIHEIRGRCSALIAGDTRLAETCYLQSIETARRMGAHTIEARATAALSNLGDFIARTTS